MLIKDKLAFTKSKWYTYLIIALFIAIGIQTIIFFITLHNLEQYKPIANFQFEESEWIKINSANVYTQGKHVVTPNDQLYVIFNVTNKVQKNILIEPEFHTYQAGHLKEVRPISPAIFGFEYTGTIDGVYYPTFEGLNIVETAFKISYSNGTFLTYQNATTGFNVISKTDELQIQQNDYVLLGFIASTIIGAGTLTVLYFTQRTSNKQIDLLKTQNKDLKDQFNLENRPWVVPSDIVPKFVSFEDGTTIDYDLAEDMIRLKTNKSKSVNRSYEIIVKNVGKLPATVRGKMINGQTKIEKDDLEKLDVNVPFVIMVGESEFFTVDINRKYLQDGGTHYVGILLEYNIDKTRISKIYKTWEIGKNFRNRVLDEIDDPDLKNHSEN